MGKGSAKQEVVDYYLSIHYGIGVTLDSIHGIYVGEKVAWEGDVYEPSAITISKPELFGGNEKEGGVEGNAYFLPGRPDQVLPEHLAQRLGRTTATAPGYRAIGSLWFYGKQGLIGSQASYAGFKWSSNNPYLKDIWMKVRRAPKGLNDALSEMVGQSRYVAVQGNSVTVNTTTATVVQGASSEIDNVTVLLNRKSLTVDDTEIIVDLDEDLVSVGGISETLSDGQKVATINGVTITITGTYTVTIGSGSIKIANFNARFNARIDANAVHIIYECMTNPDWGMGGAPSSFDLPVWQEAARTIFNEGFGLSLTWAKQATIESFVGEIVDHIQATIFINPRNGLWTIKLIRDDYDIATLPLLTADNCTITNFDRKAWGETVNEIVVTWTNPENEQEQSVVAQDLASIIIQGGIISDSRNYYGIRNATLAATVAARDLRAASAPCALFELEVNREAWDFVPGGVLVLNYPEEGYEIDHLVLRISKIDYGKPGDMTIKISAIEDIFSLPLGAYQVPPATEWLPSSEDAAAMAFTKIVTAPAYFAAEALSAASLAPFEFPEVLAMIMAAQTGTDTSYFDLISETLEPSGTITEESYGTMSVVGHQQLGGSLVPEAHSQVALTNFVGQLQPIINRFVFIGNGSESEMEIALISGYDPATSLWTLERAVLDTTPRAWAAGTPVWIVSPDSDIFDETPRSGGETVTYKLLPRTSLGILDADDAPPVSSMLTLRPWLPNRPANVKVNGTSFGTVVVGSAPTLTVSWSNRNRLLEPVNVMRWDDPSITSESGQTTRITVMRPDRSIITSIRGLTGDSYTMASAELGGEGGTMILRFTAERDGLESLQGHEIQVTADAMNGRALSGDQAGGILGPTGDMQSGTDIRIWR